MGRPYSLNLRQRVVGAVHGGMSCEEAAEHYEVSESSAIRWVRRERRCRIRSAHDGVAAHDAVGVIELVDPVVRHSHPLSLLGQENEPTTARFERNGAKSAMNCGHNAAGYPLTKSRPVRAASL